MRRFTYLLATSGLLVAALAGSAQAQRQRTVVLTFNHVSQQDNLDKGDQLGADRADFFVRVWVNGREYKTRNFSKDSGNPGWVIRAPITGSRATIRIRLLDDDSGLEQRDDHVDINPRGGKKDLDLIYNVRNGRISGDATSSRGRWITRRGGGDDDRGRVTFSIR